MYGDTLVDRWSEVQQTNAGSFADESAIEEFKLAFRKVINDELSSVFESQPTLVDPDIKAYNDIKSQLTHGYWALFVDGKFVTESPNKDKLLDAIYEMDKDCYLVRVGYEDEVLRI
jgi:hypothetical protein